MSSEVRQVLISRLFAPKTAVVRCKKDVFSAVYFRFVLLLSYFRAPTGHYGNHAVKQSNRERRVSKSLVCYVLQTGFSKQQAIVRNPYKSQTLFLHLCEWSQLNWHSTKSKSPGCGREEKSHYTSLPVISCMTMWMKLLQRRQFFQSNWYKNNNWHKRIKNIC